MHICIFIITFEQYPTILEKLFIYFENLSKETTHFSKPIVTMCTLPCLQSTHLYSAAYQNIVIEVSFAVTKCAPRTGPGSTKSVAAEVDSEGPTIPDGDTAYTSICKIMKVG